LLENRGREAYTSKTIENVDIVPSVEVINSTLTINFESIYEETIRNFSKRNIIFTFVHLDVHGTPPDIVFAGVLINNTLVLGATTGLLTREVDEGTGRGNDGTLVADGILVKKSWGSIAFDLDAIHIKAGMREVLEIAANDCWW